MSIYFMVDQKIQTVDIAAFGAHPDDCEIFMGGSILHFRKLGYRVGICDLTRGEAGTYGDPQLRQKERDEASRLLGLDERLTLTLPDGGIENTPDHRMEVVKAIRALRPQLVFTMPPSARHPDHENTHYLVRAAVFLSGLEKLDTGPGQTPHRPARLIHYPELIFSKKPDFIVDISPYYNRKKEVIKAYSSQVIDEKEVDAGTRTLIRSHEFWRRLEARSVMAGAMIGTAYGEPFYCDAPVFLDDPLKNLSQRGRL